jgi:hypothetical protein
MSEDADTFWSVTQPNKDLLLEAISDVLLVPDTNTKIEGRFTYSLTRLI